MSDMIVDGSVYEIVIDEENRGLIPCAKCDFHLEHNNGCAIREIPTTIRACFMHNGGVYKLNLTKTRELKIKTIFNG